MDHLASAMCCTLENHTNQIALWQKEMLFSSVFNGLFLSLSLSVVSIAQFSYYCFYSCVCQLFFMFFADRTRSSESHQQFITQTNGQPPSHSTLILWMALPQSPHSAASVSMGKHFESIVANGRNVRTHRNCSSIFRANKHCTEHTTIRTFYVHQ